MTNASLNSLAAEQLRLARAANSKRSAHTVFGGHESVLRQTLLALASGGALADHVSPGEATLQVLVGRVRLTTGAESTDAGVGDLLAIPPESHGLVALEDCAVLLTVGRVNPT